MFKLQSQMKTDDDFSIIIIPSYSKHHVTQNHLMLLTEFVLFELNHLISIALFFFFFSKF